MTTRLNYEIRICCQSVLLISLFFLCSGNSLAAKQLPRPAPEFTHQKSDAWLNSKPLSLEELRGKVVLLDFWTFDCWNCYRSFPWLRTLESQLENREFMVIGIHTPEFEHERNRNRLVEKVRIYELSHPIMIDNDFSFWNAVGSRYWPSFFILDKKGVIRASYFGQIDQHSAQAEKIERMVEELLSE